MQLDDLLTQVDNHRDELLTLVKDLIRFPTESPPARNTEEAQSFIAEKLREIGFSIDQWDVFPHDPNVVGTLKGEQPDVYQSLIINGHIDVAEVENDVGWTQNPFEPVVKDGRIYGRGTADMKGGLAGALFALQLLKDNGIVLPGDVIFQSVIGEEVGEAGTLECCEKGYKADGAIVVDTSDLAIQGQGGVITGWVTIKSPTTYHDALRRNMIHAGGGLYGASAIEKMVKLIEGLKELEQHWAVTKSYQGFPAGMSTINPAVIEGGRHAAFVADECRLWITVHFYPDENHMEIAKEVEDHLLKVSEADPWLRHHPPIFKWGGKSMIEDKGEIFPSLNINQEGKLVQQLTRAHSNILATKPQVGMSQTVTDGGWLGEAGIPTIIYGPGDLRNAHSTNESVEVSQLVDFTKVMLTFIYQWSHTKKEEL
ncbi:acetylornithine deacetylase [Salipaludibacillus agaradhaerens]|uniref:Acetylornithine deacetylase n=1 Tax=Salipaludibacillus agaradhaerens TaxID=76935 RepID=A0A9Q4G139_SALAG|nr:acetylornithine deacetylase [Salipaludibacillus agaradhaerens]MCR6098523.1 acetylornithine deacetylase [Salipaludibacillus agaradhaerens]MCR6115530.1 acetylornithine deacetylase [Salipaludibacillus agaradhaerens]